MSVQAPPSPTRQQYTPPRRGSKPKEALGKRRGSLKAFAELKAFQASIGADSPPPAQPSRAGTVLGEFLSQHTVDELNTPDVVIEIDSKASPNEGFRILADNNILGAPVWDAAERKYIGFLDMRDLVSQVIAANAEVEGVGANKLSPKQKARNALYHEILVKSLVKQKLAKQGMGSNLTYLAARNKFIPVRADATLLEVAKILSGSSHRVPIIGQDGKCKTIVSQSAIIEFMAKHVDDLSSGGALSESLQELGVGLKHVEAVPEGMCAYDAFKFMDDRALSGIGVLDEGTGALIGNTSARDVKFLLLSEDTKALQTPILDYLAMVRQSSTANKGQAKHPICKVGTDATLDKILRRLGATRFHRVFVADREGKPAGVVSLSDIVRLACHKPPKNRRMSVASEQIQRDIRGTDTQWDPPTRTR